MNPSGVSPGEGGVANPLVLSGVKVTFSSRQGEVRAVDAIDFTLAEGDRLALIGESGCGKTVLGMAIMGLLPRNAWIGGEIRFNGRNLAGPGQEALQQVRGKEIAMIVQNSGSALNPVQTVGDQIAEPLLIHRLMDNGAAHCEAVRLLGALGFDDPAQAALQYPHEFSGGMQERILIAIALITSPRLVIADEPTTGLDALVKQQILDLMKQQFHDRRTLLLITHELGAATFLSTRIAVMYAGEIVETGRTMEVLAHPMHPYTQGLLASLPSRGLNPIPGMSPSPGQLPPGCRFAGRCPAAIEHCHQNHPLLRSCGGFRQVRCWRYV